MINLQKIHPIIPFTTANFPIRQAIQQGNIPEAIRLLQQTGAKEGKLLFQQFAQSLLQREEGRISTETWRTMQVRICTDILELNWMKEDPNTDRIPTSIEKIELLHLIQKRQTAQAIAKCEYLGDAYVLLQMQWNLARQQSGESLMESEYWEVTKSRISDLLQELLTQIPDDAPLANSLWNKIKRLWLR